MTERTGSEQELRAEISDIDETIRRLRGERGAPNDGVGDQTDDATDLTSYEEEQALIENLEARRQRLVEKLEKQ